MILILHLLRIAIGAYMLVVVVQALMTWVPNLRGAKLELFFRRLTEPALGPIRRVLEPMQRGLGIDLSPIVLLVGLSFLQRVL